MSLYVLCLMFRTETLLCLCKTVAVDGINTNIPTNILCQFFWQNLTPNYQFRCGSVLCHMVSTFAPVKHVFYLVSLR